MRQDVPGTKAVRTVLLTGALLVLLPGALLAAPAPDAELTIVGRGNEALRPKNGIIVAADSTADAAKQAANKYIDESLAQFQAGNYEGSIVAGRKALEISPGEAVAYNNICAAYNALAKWEQVAEACTKAIQLAPDFERAKNNLAHATQMKAVAAEDYINKSLALYEAGRHAESISASQRALELRPDYVEALNNICAANIAVGRYDEGIKACAKAIELKPDYELARNNLAWGLRMKAEENAKRAPR